MTLFYFDFPLSRKYVNQSSLVSMACFMAGMRISEEPAYENRRDELATKFLSSSAPFADSRLLKYILMLTPATC